MKKLFISLFLILILTIPVIASCASGTESVEEEGIILSQLDNGKSTGATSPSYPMPESPAYDRDNDEMVVWSEESSAYEGESGAGFTTVSIPDRMIVRTGNISLVVEDVSEAIESITRYAEDFNGYVVSSSVWKNGDKLAGSISIRVDAVSFNSALAALRSMAVEVTNENTSSQDVTEEYVDLSASLENLNLTRAKLIEIYDKAETVEDILEVQRELTRIEGEIKTTEARMEYLEKTSSTSIIYVQLEQSTMYFEFYSNRRSGVKAGEKIEFTVTEISGGFAPYTYLWDFGDDETSTEMNPVHSYKTEGYYTVTLTVTDDNGNVEDNARENYIYVKSGWNAGTVASNAWSGLASFGRGLLNALIWVGIFSPVWLIIGGFIIWRIRRRKANR